MVTNNCDDMVLAVVTASGLRVPPRDTVMCPVDLVTGIKKLN
jgi:hypothetical protein